MKSKCLDERKQLQRGKGGSEPILLQMQCMIMTGRAESVRAWDRKPHFECLSGAIPETEISRRW